METRLLANLICMLQGANPEFARIPIGIWLYRDGTIMTHNIHAEDSEEAGHVALFRKRLDEASIAVKGFSICDCRQCWVALFDGKSEPRHTATTVRDALWQTAFEAVGHQPPSSDKLRDCCNLSIPDFPTVDEHIAWIKEYERHGLLQCSRMTKEGQRRVQPTNR